MRIACPACGSRLTIMARADYVVCKRCGSQYMVQRSGNTIGLESFAPEQYELSRKISEVEQSQGEGCSNVFFWIFVVAGIFFCGVGYLGRALFQTNVPLVVGWAISIIALVVAAGVLLRTLGAQRVERLKLEARQRDLYAAQGESDEEEAQANPTR